MNRLHFACSLLFVPLVAFCSQHQQDAVFEENLQFHPASNTTLGTNRMCYEMITSDSVRIHGNGTMRFELTVDRNPRFWAEVLVTDRSGIPRADSLTLYPAKNPVTGSKTTGIFWTALNVHSGTSLRIQLHPTQSRDGCVQILGAVLRAESMCPPKIVAGLIQAGPAYNMGVAVANCVENAEMVPLNIGFRLQPIALEYTCIEGSLQEMIKANSSVLNFDCHCLPGFEPRYYSSSYNAAECAPCGADYISPSGEECIRCPIAADASPDRTSCNCKPGYFPRDPRRPDTICLKEPDRIRDPQWTCSGDVIFMKWARPEDALSSVGTRYVVQRQNSDSSWRVNDPQVIIDGLKPNSVYAFDIISHISGRSGPKAVVAVTTSSPVKVSVISVTCDSGVLSAEWSGVRMLHFVSYRVKVTAHKPNMKPEIVVDAVTTNTHIRQTFSALNIEQNRANRTFCLYIGVTVQVEGFPKYTHWGDCMQIYNSGGFDARSWVLLAAAVVLFLVVVLIVCIGIGCIYCITRRRFQADYLAPSDPFDQGLYLDNEDCKQIYVDEFGRPMSCWRQVNSSASACNGDDAGSNLSASLYDYGCFPPPPSATSPECLPGGVAGGLRSAHSGQYMMYPTIPLRQPPPIPERCGSRLSQEFSQLPLTGNDEEEGDVGEGHQYSAIQRPSAERVPNS